MPRADNLKIFMSDKVNEFLDGLSLAQLTKLQASLTEKLASQAARRAQSVRVPPLPKTDVVSMADSLGLDISGLLRDVKKRGA